MLIAGLENPASMPSSRLASATSAPVLPALTPATACPADTWRSMEAMLVCWPRRNAQAAVASGATLSGASMTAKRDTAAAKGCGKRESSATMR
ncbi:hypothetical protein GCM10007158_11120 [Vreelandella hamiltonii]|uniref:Uncharacterized protein n=2 Tax=Halomonadaceae TaxID=28256 RepID=A0A8H9LWD0_9GAMM|nr:hypothetical protein GCM10007157_07190 [Halomonas hamiltonii]GGW51696.1 hypothetical protein GCM10007158_11120 [Halomonas johnsoniae]